MPRFSRKETYTLPGDQVRAALSSLDILSGLVKRFPEPKDKFDSKQYERTATRIRAQSGGIFDVDPEVVYRIRLGARDREVTREAAASMLSSEETITRTDEAARAAASPNFLRLPTPPGEPQRVVSMADFAVGIEIDIRQQMEATRRLNETLAPDQLAA